MFLVKFVPPALGSYEYYQCKILQKFLISCVCTDGKISVRINLCPDTNNLLLDGRTVENKGKLILQKLSKMLQTIDLNAGIKMLF